MALLQNHLEQISLSANAIAELPFPPPKMFANALLLPHDITTLIRDTETHERALFSVDPAQRRTTARRGTVNPGSEGDGETMASRIYSAKNSRNQSAVARVLGGDMMQQIQQSTNHSRDAAGEIDVEVLLRGAEMLCDVYPIAGAKERIAALRHRHRETSESVSRLEAQVADQSAQLEGMNFKYDAPYHAGTSSSSRRQTPTPADVSEQDLEREMEEIRELEARKKMLEDRVNGMDEDLGGLLR